MSDEALRELQGVAKRREAATVRIRELLADNDVAATLEKFFGPVGEATRAFGELAFEELAPLLIAAAAKGLKP